MTGRPARALRLALSLAALTVGVSGSLRAQEDEAVAELVTDRPDQTESAVVVPVGTLQVEGGATWVEDETDGVEVEGFDAPGTLLRYGMHPRVELRLAWPGNVEVETRTAGTTERISGVGSPELGMKFHLASEAGARPEVALLAHVVLPVGDEEVGSERADPSVRLSVAHTLSERLSLGWNVGHESASFEDDRGQVHTLGRWIYTAALGISLAERWGAFVELFGTLPASDPGPATSSLDGGVTFLVTPRLQLDLAGGVGLDGDAADRFVGFGVSFRVPR